MCTPSCLDEALLLSGDILPEICPRNTSCIGSMSACTVIAGRVSEFYRFDPLTPIPVLLNCETHHLSAYQYS